MSRGRVGVCSWSLRPRSASELVASLRACGATGVQLALEPIRTGAWDERETTALLDEAGIEVLSAMMETEGEDYSTLETIKATGGIRPDATWGANLEAAKQNADLAHRLGVSLVTLHAGFLPHEAGDPERGRMIERLRTIADVFGERGLALGLETGQESAETLEAVLEEIDRENVGVNFDPANMILYGMGEPVEALERLAARVVQVHVKDADPSERAGEWGTEQPAGEGAVDWVAFFRVVREKAPEVDLIVEREAGERRVEDIRAALSLIERQRA